MSAALLTFPRHHPRPIDHCDERFRDYMPSRHPRLAAREIKRLGAPARANRLELALHDPLGWLLAKPVPRWPFRIATTGCRSPNNGEAAFRAFIPAKSPVPSVGYYADTEADALLGLTSSGLTGAMPGVDVLPPPYPLGLRGAGPAFDRGSVPCPSGSCRQEPGHSSCEVRRPS
jgi:hypothetical protein